MIKNDDQLWTSNAGPIACLLKNLVIFLLKIMLIHDPVYDKPMWPTSMKQPLAGP